MIIPQVYKKLTSTTGYGVYARQTIPAGTIAMTECPRCQTMSHAEALNHPNKDFIFSHAPISATTYPDFLYPCKDEIYYLNHSCRANVLTLGGGIDIVVETIPAGEELTFDYRCMFDPYIDFDCTCHNSNCAGHIRCFEVPEELLEEWQHRLTRVIPLISQVPQPIMDEALDARLCLEQMLRKQRTKRNQAIVF
jgi:hypothetical protein